MNSNEQNACVPQFKVPIYQRKANAAYYLRNKEKISKQHKEKRRIAREEKEMEYLKLYFDVLCNNSCKSDT